ncbi:MAG TPA: hypothetical protein VFV99_33385 [Kofleriaceae bacterium]|nr:hypothetical protein [Kofleriaceae bacterium]
MTTTAKPLKLSEADLRLIARWVSACAARALPLFEVAAPRDTRPRDALAGIRLFVRGGKRTAQLRSLALAALAAAREVGDPVATAAARAAGYAAASAYTHPLASPHQIKHILGPVVYAARARELAADDATAGDKELASALRRATPALRNVVRRFPSRRAGRSRLDQLYSQLDAGLRRR